MRERQQIAIAVAVATLVVACAVLWLLGRFAPSADSNQVALVRNGSTHETVGERSNRSSLLAPKLVGNSAAAPAANDSDSSNSVSTDTNVLDPEHVEARKATVISPSAVVLDWNLAKVDYERILADPEASQPQKDEASLRLQLRLWDRPGHNANRLGGFSFDPKDYRALDAFELQPRPEWMEAAIVHMSGNPPSVSLERRWRLTKAASQLDVSVTVFPSIAAAQRSVPITEDFTVGDMCSTDGDGLQTSGRAWFVRHNVVVALDLAALRIKGDSVLLDVVGLAMKIDEKVQAQSHRATTWADLAPFSPIIEEFAFVEGELPTGNGGTQTAVRLHAYHPNGSRIHYEWKGEPTVAPNGGLGVNPGKPKFANIAPDMTYEERPYKAWVVVYDDSLLFTIAEASIMVRPSK